MNMIKRGCTTIIRQSGKSVLLFSLVLILGVITAGAISVHLAINNTNRNLLHQIPNAMTIGENPNLAWTYFDYDFDNPELFNRPRLTPELVSLIGELPYVQHFDYMESTYLYSFEQRGYWGWQSENISDFEGPISGGFSLLGTSRNTLIQFEIGTMNLTEGRGFTEEELLPSTERAPIIISEQVAWTNNLRSGDLFQLYSLIFMNHQDWVNFMDGINLGDIEYKQISMEFEVVGLFDVPITSEVQNMGNFLGADSEAHQLATALNTLYVPNWAIRNISERTRKALYEIWEAQGVHDGLSPSSALNASSILNLYIVDHDDMTAFREAAEPFLPSQFYQIYDFSYRIQHLGGAMANLQDIADWVLFGSIGATLITLSLLFILTLKDRIIEMGIYLALGEKKWKIYLQVLFEALSISFLAITLALFMGNILSQNLSQAMVVSEINEQWEARDRFDWPGGALVFARLAIPNPSLSPEEMIELFDTSLTAETMGVFYLVGLGTVAVSTLMPLAWLLSMNPRNILLGETSKPVSSGFKPKHLGVLGAILASVLMLTWWLSEDDTIPKKLELYEEVHESLSMEQQQKWDMIVSRVETGFSAWDEALVFAVMENLTVSLREGDEPIGEELRTLINRYGLRGDFSHASIGIGSLENEDEVVLLLHFENLSHNQLMEEFFALQDRELASWLASGGRERLEAAFERVEVVSELGSWEILYFDRFKVEGRGSLVLRETVALNSPEDEEHHLLYGTIIPIPAPIWIVGEHLPAGRYLISSAERTGERMTELEWNTSSLEDRVVILQEGRTVDERFSAGRIMVYLEEGDQIQISGIVYATPITERRLSDVVGRGMWTVGKDVAPGLVDLAPIARTGRISLERDGEILFSEVVGSGFLAEGREIPGIPRVRAHLQIGDTLHVSRIPQVSIAPFTIE